MPAIFDSLVHARGLTPHVAWRVAYIVPFVLITATAVGMLLLCDDTPTGKWSDRHIILQGERPSPSLETITAQKAAGSVDPMSKETLFVKPAFDVESVGRQPSSLLDTARAEVIVPPNFSEALSVIFSRHTLAVAAPYACSFGRLRPSFHVPRH